MKKNITYKLLYLTVALAYLPLQGFANQSGLFLSKFEGSGAPVAYLNIKTPDGKPHEVDDVKVFAGISEAAPCSDLKVVVDGWSQIGVHLPPGTKVYLVAQTMAFSETNLQQWFAMNPVTCVQIDFYKQGTAYASVDARVDSEVTAGGYNYSVLSPGSVIDLMLG